MADIDSSDLTPSLKLNIHSIHKMNTTHTTLFNKKQGIKHLKMLFFPVNGTTLSLVINFQHPYLTLQLPHN